MCHHFKTIVFTFHLFSYFLFISWVICSQSHVTLLLMVLNQRVWLLKFILIYFDLLYPAPSKVEWVYTGFTPMSVRPSVGTSVRPSVRLSVDKVSGTFWRNYWLNSFHTWHFMRWVSWPLYMFVFLASFSALWWPNIWPKMGFPELSEKTIGPIHFIPGIYPYGVFILTPLHFCVPSLFFGTLVAKYLAENGVCRTFWKNTIAPM